MKRKEGEIELNNHLNNSVWEPKFIALVLGWTTEKLNYLWVYVGGGGGKGRGKRCSMCTCVEQQ